MTAKGKGTQIGTQVRSEHKGHLRQKSGAKNPADVSFLQFGLGKQSPIPSMESPELQDKYTAAHCNVEQSLTRRRAGPRQPRNLYQYQVSK